MKNTLKNLLASLLSIVILGITPLHAAELKPVLTLENAIHSAVVRSNELSFKSRENDLLTEQLKMLWDGNYLSYQTIYIQKAQNEQQAKFITDQIAYDITNRYNNLVLLEKEIANLDVMIAFNTQKLRSTDLRKKIGLISTFEYNNAVLQLDMQKNTQASKYAIFTQDRNHFKTLTGKDLSHYILDDTLTYEPFHITTSLDAYFSNITDELLKYNRELLDLQVNNFFPPGSPAMDWLTYLNKKLTLDKSASSLESTEKDLKQGLMTSYSTLLGLEEQINTMQDQLKLMQNQTELLKLQHQVGLITDLDYKSQLLNLQDMELGRRRLVNNYTSLKVSIQKPWLIGGGR